MKIGLMVHNFTNSATLSIAETLQRECERLGHTLLVFEGRELGSRNALFRYYNSIYSLIGKQGIDGLIMASSTVVRTENRLAAEHFASQLNLPCICIGRPVGQLPLVRTDNHSGIQSMFAHLYEHGCRRIAHVTGHLGQADAISRLEQYQTCLTDYGLSQSADLTFEGDFSRQSGRLLGVKLAEAIRSQAIDGILFANDDMLFGALETFREEGIRCPEDIRATGYDNNGWSAHADPPFTTVGQNYDLMGEVALNLLLETFLGKTPPPETLVPVKPVVRNSCGCTQWTPLLHHEVLADIPRENNLLAESLQTNNLDTLTDLLEQLLPEQGISDLVLIRHGHTAVFNSFQRYEPPMTSTAQFCLRDGIRYTVEGSFPTREILPPNLPGGNSPRAYVIKPLFFGEEIYGYMLAGFLPAQDHLVDEVRVHTASLIKSSLLLEERIVMEHRLKDAMAELRSANRRLNTLSTRDDLTGLFNRRGFLQEAESYLSACQNEAHLVGYVDMDNLKIINDRFGHEEGDLAIREVARILNACVRDRDIVARLGGDEFIVFIKGATESLISVLEKRFSEELAGCALRQDKPYTVCFSWGFLLAAQKDRLEDTIRKADERMLIEKRRKKGLAQSGAQPSSQ